jgi:hypothetical protein
MATKDELEQENADLRAELEQAQADLDRLAAAAPAAAAPAPRYPTNADGSRQLSSGELNDLQTTGITVSPFDGATLNALDEGVEPGNPEARRRAELEQARPDRVDPNEWPIAGPPPAEGGDSDPDATSSNTGR